MSRVIVFDLIGTLLDLQAMDSHFERFFGDAAVRKEWFMQTLQLAMAATLTNAYEDFGVQADTGLEITARHYKVSLLGEEKNLILGTLRKLRPYPEVAQKSPALARRRPKARHTDQLDSAGGRSATHLRRAAGPLRTGDLGRRGPPLQTGARSLPLGGQAAGRGAGTGAVGGGTRLGRDRRTAGRVRGSFRRPAGPGHESLWPTARCERGGSGRGRGADFGG